ncbi:MAG: hypothetical protein ACE369_08535 [Roseovarius sp.]
MKIGTVGGGDVPQIFAEKAMKARGREFAASNDASTGKIVARAD